MYYIIMNAIGPRLWRDLYGPVCSRYTSKYIRSRNKNERTGRIGEAPKISTSRAIAVTGRRCAKPVLRAPAWLRSTSSESFLQPT
jgi:hypothetical protein